MFSDFKTRGFGLEDSQVRHPDRLARLILVMALALYLAVSTGQWDVVHHATPSERKRPEQRPKNVLRSMMLWFTRGPRRIANLLQTLQPNPQLWSVAATNMLRLRSRTFPTYAPIAHAAELSRPT